MIIRDITERKRVEETLRQQMDLYESLLKAQSDLGEGVVITEGERIVYLNDALCEIYGYSEAELLAMPSFLELVVPEERALLVERLRQRLSGKSMSDRNETTILHKNGYRVNIEYAVKQVRIGDRTQSFAIIRDITERRRAEEELIRLSGAVRMSTDSIVLTDIEAKIIEVNEATLKMYGTDGKRDLIGKSAFDLIVPEEREKAFAGMEEVLEKGTVRNREYHIITKNGGTIPVELSAAIMKDEDGKPVGFVAISRNITERKQVEEEQAQLQAAIQKSALEWQLTFDTIESPILILDLSGVVIRLNRAAKELLGNSYQESIGRTVEVLRSGQPWQKAAEIVSLIRETRCATSYQARDESSGKTWDMAASLLTGPGVDDERIILVARDITRMVELQASLRRSETMSAMGSLVAGVAHEVRNPLFGISSILDAFEARFGAREEYQQYLSILRGELDRLNRLMRELLEYGKPLSLEMSQGSIGDIIAEAVHSCAPLAKRLRVEIATSLGEGLAPVRMDRGRLLEVFQNLLENAIQHSPPGGMVKVEAEEVRQNDQTWIDCAIKDSGPGFRMEDLPRIFELFFTRRRGGTGLGLAIVQRIVEEHGGKISAGNRPEGGAVMAVRFPSVQR